MISTVDGLASFCRDIENEPIICIDTEFIREESYIPRLELIQINAGGKIDIIDIPVIKDMTPLWDVLYRDNVIKVLHSCQQDVSLLYLASGQLLTNIFDTQVAGALVGYGEQTGYGQLVRMITGVNLSKSQSYTPWGLRPLTPAQIDYAIDDVRYLPDIYDELNKQLSDLNRVEWAKSEFSILENSPNTDPLSPDMLYTKIRNYENLEPKELAILRELAIWRDDEAKYRNKLPQRLLRDELLLSLARNAPQNISDIKRLRGFPPVEIERHGQEILAVVKKGVNIPKESYPEKPKPKSVDSNAQTLISLIQAFIRVRANELQLSPGILYNSGDIEYVATNCINEDEFFLSPNNDIKLLSSWRYDIIAHQLQELLNGNVQLSYQPITKKVTAL